MEKAILRTKARPPRAVVRWSWLHATACSSAIVASVAYMHSELSVYLASVDRQQASDDLFLSAAAVATLGSEQLEGLHALLSIVASRLRWLLVMLALLVWFGGLVLSRRYRLHRPIRRASDALLKSVGKVCASVSRRRKQKKKTSQRRQQKHGRRQRGLDKFLESSGSDVNDFDADEIDENDLLIVTSLSQECQAISNLSGRRLSTATEDERKLIEAHSRSNSAGAGKIVLNPRDGASGGRHQSNQIISDDPFVSRYHFQIQYDPLEKEYFLQDLGSTTGTFVFLKPDVPKRLHIHDRVKLGDTEFEVVAIDENLTTGTPFLRICFTEGPLTGVGQTIGKTAVTLGRRSSNALCVTDDDSISSRHSVISYIGNGFYITDLHSTNGTALRLSPSGEKSKRRYLMHGDVFGVGSNRFLVEYSHQLDLQAASGSGHSVSSSFSDDDSSSSRRSRSGPQAPAAS